MTTQNWVLSVSGSSPCWYCYCPSFRQFPHTDLQTCINADFILPPFYASTEFVLNPLIVKPLQHAIRLKAIETNKGAESHFSGLYTQGPRIIFLMVFICNPRNRMWCFFQLILLSFSLTAIILLHEKFCNLIGLEPWYFSLIWNTYMWKLQTVCSSCINK